MELKHDQNADNNPETCEVDEQSAMERETRAKWEPFRASFTEWALANGESPSAFDRNVEAHVEHNRAAYQKERASKELEESSVIWDRVTAEDCDALRALLETNPKEQEMHEFLEKQPQVSCTSPKWGPRTFPALQATIWQRIYPRLSGGRRQFNRNRVVSRRD